MFTWLCLKVFKVQFWVAVQTCAAALVAAGEAWPLLATLELTEVTFFDAALEGLRACSALHRLELHDVINGRNRRLSSADLYAMPAMPSLEVFQLCGLLGLCPASEQALSKRHPGVSIQLLQPEASVR